MTIATVAKVVNVLQGAIKATNEANATIEHQAKEIERLKAENASFLKALEYIAHFDENALRGAATLHIDMNGVAREALKQQPNQAGL